MKWFILVLFFNQGDPYIFTKPTFDSEDQCIGTITDPQFYPSLIEQLIQDYEGRMEKIDHVFCIDKNQLKILLEYRNTQDV